MTIIPTILLSIVLNFTLLHLAPGDPTLMYSEQGTMSGEQMEALRKELGLDQPLPVQFMRYMERVVQGDLGNSLSFRRPVLELILERLPATLMLTLTSAALAVAIGTTLGAIAARKWQSRTDTSLSFANYAMDAMPSFWLGLILIVIFASILGWLPTSGMRDVRANLEGWPARIDVLRHMILPVATLTIVQIPTYFRITRASVQLQLSEDYVTTFTAAGIPRSRIFRTYALKNAILPTVTMFGLSLGFAFTGAALVEIVFAWPGIGRLTLDAVFRRDYPLLLGVYLVLAVMVSLAVLITDILYAYLDPRIRFR